MLEAIRKVFESSSPAKDAHSVNLSNSGWHINAEGSDEKAIAGARLALELLRSHYDAVLAIYPGELAGFETMLQSVAPQAGMLPLESCTNDAFTVEALKNSKTVFTLKYSLEALFNDRHEKVDPAVNRWFMGMRNLLSKGDEKGILCDVRSLVLIVGENPLGIDVITQCRAIGVGRVLISNNDVSKYAPLELPQFYRLARYPGPQRSDNPMNRSFTVSELQAGHIPPIISSDLAVDQARIRFIKK